MNISIKCTNIELTDAIRDYTERRLESIEKFVGGSGQVMVELEKTTNHHKQGEIFRAEANVVTSTGAQYRAVSEKADLYQAVDDVKGILSRELSAGKGKQRVLWKRGAQTLKSLMHGGYETIRGGYEKIRRFSRFRNKKK